MKRLSTFTGDFILFTNRTRALDSRARALQGRESPSVIERGKAVELVLLGELAR